MVQTEMMPDVLTDEEMAKLESSSPQDSMPDILTDEEMAKLEGAPAQAVPEPALATPTPWRPIVRTEADMAAKPLPVTVTRPEGTPPIPAPELRVTPVERPAFPAESNVRQTVPPARIPESNVSTSVSSVMPPPDAPIQITPEISRSQGAGADITSQPPIAQREPEAQMGVPVKQPTIPEEKIQPGKTLIEGTKQVVRSMIGMGQAFTENEKKHNVNQAEKLKRYAEGYNLSTGEKEENLTEKQIEQRRKFSQKQQSRVSGEKETASKMDTAVKAVVNSPLLAPDEKYFYNKATGLKGYVQDVILMAPQIALQAAVTAGTGGAGGIVFMGGQIAGQKYLQYRDQGVDPGLAIKISLIDAAAQAPLEQIGINKALKGWNPALHGSQAIREIVASGGTEFLTEWIQQYPDAAADIWAMSKGKTDSEKVGNFIDRFWETTREGLYQGLVAAPLGGGVSGAGIAVNKIMSKGPQELPPPAPTTIDGKPLAAQAPPAPAPQAPALQKPEIKPPAVAGSVPAHGQPVAPIIGAPAPAVAQEPIIPPVPSVAPPVAPGPQAAAAKPTVEAPPAADETNEQATARISNRLAVIEGDIKGAANPDKIRRRMVDQGFLGKYGITSYPDMEDAATEFDKAGIPYTVEFADGGNWKAVNDAMPNHAEADKLFSQAYGDVWVSEAKAAGGIVFRTGKDEFGALWPNKTPEQVRPIREQIEAKIRAKRDELGFGKTAHARSGLPTGAMHTDYVLKQGVPGKFGEIFNAADSETGKLKSDKDIALGAELGYTYNRENKKWEPPAKTEAGNEPARTTAPVRDIGRPVTAGAEPGIRPDIQGTQQPVVPEEAETAPAEAPAPEVAPAKTKYQQAVEAAESRLKEIEEEWLPEGTDRRGREVRAVLDVAREFGVDSRKLREELLFQQIVTPEKPAEPIPESLLRERPVEQEAEAKIGDIITDGLVSGKVLGEGTIKIGKKSVPAYKVEIISGKEKGKTSLISKADAKRAAPELAEDTKTKVVATIRAVRETATRKDAASEGWSMERTAEELAGLDRNAESLYKSLDDAIKSRSIKALRDMVHPSNKAWRAGFEVISGKKLPRDVNGSEGVLRDYIGAAEYNTYWKNRKDKYAEDKVEREEKTRQAERDLVLNAKVRANISGKEEVMTNREMVDRLIESGYTNLKEYSAGKFPVSILVNDKSGRLMKFKKKHLVDYIRERLADIKTKKQTQAADAPIPVASVEPAPATMVETSAPASETKPEEVPAEPKDADYLDDPDVPIPQDLQKAMDYVSPYLRKHGIMTHPYQVSFGPLINLGNTKNRRQFVELQRKAIVESVDKLSEEYSKSLQELRYSSPETTRKIEERIEDVRKTAQEIELISKDVGGFLTPEISEKIDALEGLVDQQRKSREAEEQERLDARNKEEAIAANPDPKVRFDAPAARGLYHAEPPKATVHDIWTKGVDMARIVTEGGAITDGHVIFFKGQAPKTAKALFDRMFEKYGKDVHPDEKKIIPKDTVKAKPQFFLTTKTQVGEVAVFRNDRGLVHEFDGKKIAYMMNAIPDFRLETSQKPIIGGANIYSGKKHVGVIMPLRYEDGKYDGIEWGEKPVTKAKPAEVRKGAPAAQPVKNVIIKKFVDEYDPRRLSRDVDSYLKENAKDINNFGSTEEGVGYYKDHIVYELKNGDLVYMDSPDDVTNTLVKISPTDSEFKTIESLSESRKSWTPRGASSMGQARPEPKTPLPITESSAAAIEDFGSKLYGARKDYYADYIDKLEKSRDVDIAAAPLSASWPEPKYEALIEAGKDPWIVGFVRAAREEIPTKPQKSYRLSRWVQNVSTLRGLSDNLLSGKITKERFLEKLNEPEFFTIRRDVGGRAELYTIFGHSVSLKGVKMAQHHYSIYRGEKDVDKWIISKEGKATHFSNMGSELGVGNTKEEAIEAFRAKYGDLSGEGGERKTEFIVYKNSRTGKFYVGKKMGSGRYLDMKEFETAKEAVEYRKNNQAALESQLEKLRDVPAERRDFNRERIGKDHRGGKDVTPEMFQEAFGFRGVEFGNWVNSGERQSSLNRAYDALYDLANILNVPTRAVSLNGELGLGFGSRGHGGKMAPAAHYETDRVVINLTRKNGPGSLAHEWMHAFDNYLSRRRGKGLEFMTDTPRMLGATDTSRPELVNAVSEVVRAIGKTDLEKRSLELDKTRTGIYWSQRIEMAARSFESYVIDKLKDGGATNDYLANVATTPEYAKALADYLLNTNQPGDAEMYPYLLDSEMPIVKDAFDGLVSAIKTEATDKGVAMFQRDLPEISEELTLDFQQRVGVEHELPGRKRATDQNSLSRTRIAQSALERYLQRRLPNDSVVPVEPNEEERVSGDFFKALHGINLQVVRISADISESVRFNGFNVGNNTFINERHSHPVFLTASHEALEYIRRMHPDLYSPVLEATRENLTEEGLAQAQKLEDNNDPDGAAEILNDFAADQMADPSWWQNLYNKSPEAAKRLLESIARIYRQLVEYIKGKRLTKTAWFKDVEAMRDNVTGLYKQVLEREAAGGDVATVFNKSPMMQREIAPREQLAEPWYSPTLRAAQWLKQERGAGDQMLSMLMKTPGVKKAEVEWIGLDDFLKGKKSVTKQEIEDFVRENQVEIKDVEKGKEPFKSPLSEEESARLEELSQVTDLSIEEEAEYKKISKKFKNAKDVWVATSIPKTKFSQYTLPGGENYREVLLTLPVVKTGKSPNDFTREELLDMLQKNDQNGAYTDEAREMENDGQPNAMSKAEAVETIKRISDEEGYDVFGFFKSSSPAEGNFSSSHWDEPNVIAHIRMDDRTGPDGEKVLFIEEIQSDWAREGREKGVQGAHSDTKKWVATQTNKGSIGRAQYEITDDGGRVRGTFRTNVIRAGENEQGMIDRVAKDEAIHPGVPNQPFLRNWEDLTLKRVLKMAADEGYDRVAWINGAQTADRYDLSKQVKNIDWSVGEKPGLYHVGITTPDGRQLIVGTSLTAKAVEANIGKDATQKMLENEKRGETNGVLEGNDLKIGGNWAFNLYDKKIPNFLNDFGKKFGARVEPISIDVGEFKVNRDSRDAANPFRLEKKASSGILSRHPTAEAAWAEAERLGSSGQMSIPITPAMRELARSEGMPMFQKVEPFYKSKNGNELVDYEWRSKWGVKFSEREGGDVEAKISDWENKDKSTGTGRDIVHVYYIKSAATGEVEPHGIESAKKMLGLASDAKLKSKAEDIVIAKKIAVKERGMRADDLEKMASDDPNVVNSRFWDRGYSRERGDWDRQILYEKDGKYIRVMPDYKSGGLTDSEILESNGYQRVYSFKAVDEAPLFQRDPGLFEPDETPRPKAPPIPAEKRAALDRIYAAEREKKRGALSFLKGEKSLKDAKQSIIAELLTPISTELELISPKLKFEVLRKFEFNFGLAVQDDTRAALPFLNKYKKMDRGDRDVMDFALKNRDDEKVDELLKKYGFEKERADLQKTLDGIYDRARSVGLDVKYLGSYFPRKVIDAEGLVEATSKGEYGGLIEDQVTATEKKLGRPLSDMEKAKIADAIISAPDLFLNVPGAAKERTIGVVDNDLNRFYDYSPGALVNYIHDMNYTIELRRLFGKSSQENPLVMDVNKSIGEYVLGLIEEGKIDAKKQDKVIGILRARFNYVPSGGATRTLKNIGYLTSMGSGFSSFLSQLGDLAWAYYTAPEYATQEWGKSIVGKSAIHKEDLGVDRIAEEFRTVKGMDTVLKAVFNATLLTRMDSIGKDALINSAHRKYMALAKGNSQSLRVELERIFGDETDGVIESLKAGTTDDVNVKYLLFNKLLDFQPVALSEMPKKYLDSPNGRIFYMLKTFTIKQIDVFRREGIWKIKNAKTPGEMAKAIAGLMGLAGLFIMANAGADELKDLLFGREVTIRDRVVDNIFRLLGLSRFLVWEARRNGVASSIYKLITPPMDIVEAPVKDAVKAAAALEKGEPIDVKNMETWKIIPFFGKHYYWWFGGGAKSQEKKDIKKISKKLSEYREAPDKNDVPTEEELGRLRKYKKHTAIMNHLKGGIAATKETGDKKKNEKLRQMLKDEIKTYNQDKTE